MQPKTFLLPLSREEVLALSAIVAAALTAIDTTKFSSEMQRNLMKSQVQHLKTVQDKLTKVR